MSLQSKSASSIPLSTNNNDDDEVAAVIRDAYQRAHATFESSDCRSDDASVIDRQGSDIEKCLAEVYRDLLRQRQPSSYYPPGSSDGAVHNIDRSEHYHDDDGSRATGDEMIIDVDRFASRQGRRRSSNEEATQYYKSSADVDAVDPESATAADAADYDDDNSDPIIYVSNNHSLHSMSTLGTMGLFTTQYYGNEGSAKKEGKSSFTTNQGGEHHTEQQSIALLDRAINDHLLLQLHH